MDHSYWQKECLSKGFEYVRESDDHYVVASPEEMVSLLREVLGIDVRQKDGSSYEKSVRELEDQIDSITGSMHLAYEENERLRAAEKDAARYRWFRENSLQIVSVRTDWVHNLDACIDEEMRFQELRHEAISSNLGSDDQARKCHSPECWCCQGTGVSQRPDIPGVCDVNDKIPF